MADQNYSIPGLRKVYYFDHCVISHYDFKTGCDLLSKVEEIKPGNLFSRHNFRIKRDPLTFKHSWAHKPYMGTQSILHRPCENTWALNPYIPFLYHK